MNAQFVNDPKKKVAKKNAVNAVADDSANSIDLLELIYRIYDKKWFIIAATVFCTAVMAVYSWFIAKPVYQSQSIMYVRNNTSVINLNELQTGSSLTSDYLKLFEIHEVQERVVDGVYHDVQVKNAAGEIETEREYTIEGLNKTEKYKDIKVSTIKNMLNVTNPNGTRYIYVTANGTDPELTKDLANKAAEVVSHFIREEIKDAGADTKEKENSRMNKTSPSIISEAVTGTKISPNKTRNVILGFIAGLILSIVIIVLQYALDVKIKTADDIRKYTGMATLAVVPLIKDDRTDKAMARAKKKNGRKH